MKRWAFAACAAVVVCMSGHAEDPPKLPDSAAQIKGIPFRELVETFATNEVRAEALYQGKPISVTGTVARVITSRYPPQEEGKHAYVVELKAGEPGLSDVYVLFFFNKAEGDQLADLRAGQEVTIQGLCVRPTIYAGDRRMKQRDCLEVPGRDCKIVK